MESLCCVCGIINCCIYEKQMAIPENVLNRHTIKPRYCTSGYDSKRTEAGTQHNTMFIDGWMDKWNMV